MVGEVLFDRFPDGARALGGAPFNVACNLAALGRPPRLVTRIGEDADGARVLRAMGARGLDITSVQSDPARPTGQVIVRPTGAGSVAFDILPDQAYDGIDAEAAAAAAQPDAASGALLYHGTLLLRTPAGRAAITRLREVCTGPVVVDLNLRAPWWRADVVRSHTRGATLVKLSAEELDALQPGPAPEAERALELRDELDCRWLVVTDGPRGSWALVDDEHFSADAAPLAGHVHPVGAGDAYTAGLITGLLEGWPAPRTLARAAQLAALACRQNGAVPDDDGAHRALHARWIQEDHD